MVLVMVLVFHVLFFCFFDGFGFSCSAEVESGLVNMYVSVTF